MSDSKRKNKRVGFSTGALEKGNYLQALHWLFSHHILNVELSALRIHELRPLLDDLDYLPVERFAYVSFHAPSAFPAKDENTVVDLLGRVFERGWNIIVHPDVIRQPALWRQFGRRLLLENMDRRKNVARTAQEMDVYFAQLPEARLCLDLAHARQLDTTLIVLSEIIHKFRSRIAEIHISELDSNCRHQLMSWTSVADYRLLARDIAPGTPIIIESMLDGIETSVRLNELMSAEYAMGDRQTHTQGLNNPAYLSHPLPLCFSCHPLKHRPKKLKETTHKNNSARVQQRARNKANPANTVAPS